MMSTDFLFDGEYAELGMLGLGEIQADGAPEIRADLV